MIVPAATYEDGTIGPDLPPGVKVKAASRLPDGRYRVTPYTDEDREQIRVATLPIEDRIALKRREVEEGGVVWNGVEIATDRESRAMMDGALHMLRSSDEPRTVRWKTKSGARVEIDADTLHAINTAVWEHVEAAFDREAELMAQVDAGEPVDLDAGWPPGGA